MIEIGFRVLGPAPIQPRRIEPGVPFVARPGNRLEYQPGAKFASIYDPAADSRGYFGPTGRVEYSINEFGFRGPAPEIPKPPGVVRIACLGDSFTFGEGVRDEDTWPAVLAARLNSARPAGVASYDVINAGVQGYGLVDELLWYGLRIEKLNPDIVVLAFFMNDLAPTHETIRINDEMHRPESATGLARFSAVADWFQRRRRAERLQERYFQSIRESFSAAGRETLDQALSGFKSYADERGVRLLVVVFPVLWGLDANYPLREQHAIVSRVCDKSGIQHIDLLDVFTGTRAESLWVHPTDQHPNEIAQRRAAAVVSDAILGKKRDH
ncbi:MAG TPA: SGNH/GDSL hydrolase family protein [Phycisphaerae bacterium]|nr:SGNH/GDSL hydrolase family protein [Phycisphaerae bacterium]HRW53004.1 SGNH/GDSL hydrolase family protein [Phycisphaerae bacterium]